MTTIYQLGILLLAASSIASAAPCTSGSTILQLSTCVFGTVTVSNGANSWTLSNFGADSIVSSGYASGVNGSSANNFVAVSWAPYTVGNQFGFAVTFTTSGSANLFSAQSAGGIDQQAAFSTNFTVTANDAFSNIITYGLYISGWSAVDNTVGDVGPSVRVNKSILDPTTVSNLQADQTLIFRNPVSIGSITQPEFSVVDAYQINSGQGGASASIVNYTNYFLPAATQVESVPEPSTLGLVVAGLALSFYVRKR